MQGSEYLFLLASNLLGGAETVVRRLASDRALRGYGTAVILMSRRAEGSAWDTDELNRVLQVEAPSEISGLFQTVRHVWRLSRQAAVQFTFGSHLHVNALLGVLRRAGILKTRYLIFRESTVFADRFSGFRLRIFKSLYRIAYAQADLVICQTEYMRDSLYGLMPSARRWPVVVIPNPVSVAEMDARARESVDLSLVPSDRYIVAAGRLMEVKGFDVLIRAYAGVAKRFPDIHLLILGEGPQRNQLEELARELNIAERVHIPGRVTNPLPYFARAEACVMSSRVEGFPNVLLEMMAVQGRVVSTRCAGGIEKLDGVLHCPPGDSEALHEALVRVLARPAVSANLRKSLEGREPEAYWARIESALANARSSNS